jgi:hypothetical protein
MSSVRDGRAVLVWCDGPREQIVQGLLGRMAEIQVLAVGGPRRGQIAGLADSLGVKLHDDLRKMLIDYPAGSLVLATAEGVGAAELKAAHEARVAVVSLEPPMWAADAGGSAENWMAAVTVVPSLRMSPAWLSAAEPLEAVGKLRSVQLSSLGPRSAGTLFARLYECVEMLVHLLGVPLTVDAALTGGPAEPPEELAAVTGDLTAHLRFRAGPSAILHVSDRSAAWSRRLVVLGEQGQLALGDVSYTLLDCTGRTLDTLAAPSKSVDPADLIAHQWKRQLEGAALPMAVDVRAVHMCCRAALLSCRTSQLESPETLLRIGAV